MNYALHSPSVRGNTAPLLAARTARRSVGVTFRRSLGIACQRAEYSDAENNLPNSYHHHHSRPCAAVNGSQSCLARTWAKPARNPGCVTMISQDVPRELIELLAMPSSMAAFYQTDFSDLVAVSKTAQPDSSRSTFSACGAARTNRFGSSRRAARRRHQPICFKRACIVALHDKFVREQ